MAVYSSIFASASAAAEAQASPSLSFLDPTQRLPEIQAVIKESFQDKVKAIDPNRVKWGGAICTKTDAMNPESPFIKALMAGNLPEVQRYHAEEEIDLDDSDMDEGSTPLHLAVAHKHYPIITWLLECGVNASAIDNQRIKPLQIAIDMEDLASIQILVEKGGVDINAWDGRIKGTLPNYAVIKNKFKAAQELVRLGGTLLPENEEKLARSLEDIEWE